MADPVAGDDEGMSKAVGSESIELLEKGDGPGLLLRRKRWGIASLLTTK